MDTHHEGSGKMTAKRLIKKTWLVGPIAAIILGAGALIGCGTDIGIGEGREAGGQTVSREISESGNEAGGEHRGSVGEEGSGATLAPDETFDATRGGARLIMSYDPASNAFDGTVENTTTNTLTNVRIEIHLSNGTELGPTTPMDMAPGEVATITMPSTQASFTGWVAHAEVGSGDGGGEVAGGESGPDGPEGPESGAEAAMEAAMSSPITPLEQTWNGVLGGLAVSASYDATTQTVHTTVQNTTQQTLCYVQSEPHLKSGGQTVGELGPGKMGDLAPGQSAASGLAVSAEPELAGVSYDGSVIHMDVFDCGGPGPVAHTSAEGAEVGSGEGHGPGGEGGSESAGVGSERGPGGGEEGSGAMLAPDETFDATRGGARLVMGYDASINAFRGMVENTTASVLTDVRIEVHLSNGAELGPTTRVDMAPGEMLGVILPATPDSFTGWVAHAEVGSGDGGGESGGEHGATSGSGGESGGEHGSGREGSGGN